MTNPRAKAWILLFLLFFPLFFGLIPVSASVTIAQSATADPAEATTQEYQQHIFQAKGRYWVFYSDGSDILFETSLDGTTWSSPTTLTDCGVLGAFGSGHHFSLFYSPSYDRVAYACGATHQIGDRGDDNRGFYRQGLPNADGTITWDAAEQAYTVAATTSLNQSWMPTITIDREGKSWIAATKDYYDSGTHPNNNGSVWVTHSSTTDGTWTTASGFPYLLNSSNTNDRGWNPIVVANDELTGWRVVVIYNQAYENYTQAQSYTGSTWTHETIHTSYNDTLSYTKDAIVIDGVIYLIQRFGSGESMHMFTRTAAGVWSELGTSPAPDAGGPAIGATTDEDKIILVYAWGNNIRYRIYDIATATWTAESILDTYVGGSVPNGMQSSYQALDLIAEWTEDDGASPYPVWFAIYNPLTFAGVTIENVGCSDYLFAQEAYYDFNMTYTIDEEFGYTLDTAQLAFQDGLANWINATYDPTASGRAAWILDAGHDVAELATGSVVTDGGTYYVNFPLYLEHDIGDAVDVDIYQYVNTTDGLSEGWTLSEADAFNIYNLGGFTETSSSGTAGRIAGGDVFELYAQNNSWVEVNQTWHNLQHIHTLFGYRMTDSGAGEDQYLQDAGHDDGGSEKSSDKGDWQLRISIYYCDPSDVWVEGWAVLLQMEEGDEGANDEWHGINATWYQRGVQVDTDVFYTFIEEEPIAQTRVFVDLWFNQINASETWGGRVGAYYHGMQQGVAYLMWGTGWSPFLTNQSQAMAFGQLEDNSGSVISAPELSLMKIGFNLSRPTTQTGENDFRITLQDFDLLEPRMIESTMKGVSTPVFVSPKVPDMPTGDFWAPIVSVFSDLIDALLEQLTIVGDQIWTFLVDNIPYLGEVYGMLVDSWDVMWSLLSTFMGHLINLFNTLVDLLELIVYPLTVIGDVWDKLVDLWVEMGFDEVPGMATALILVLFGAFVFTAIADGNWGALEDMARRGWGISSAIIELSFRLVKMLVDVVIKLAGVIGNYIPFT